MLMTQETTLVMADSTLNNRKFYLIFEGSCSSYHMRSGLSFDLGNPLDRYEIEIINGLSGVAESQVVGRPFRLIIDVNELTRSKFEIEIKAIGHATKDAFLVVDSGLGLMTYEEAMSRIATQSSN